MANYVTQTSDKDKKTAAILCACGFLGIGGLHYFYVGRIGKGMLYLFTCGLFLIGTIMDLLSISTGAFRDNAGAPLRTTNAHPSRTSIPAVTTKLKYEFYPVKVAGVTFKNDRKSRQSILRKIKFKDPPFDSSIELSLSKYEFEGKPAIAVTANNEQIGNVPAEQVPYLMENWNRIESISAINVYGGGKSEKGVEISFGAEITVRLHSADVEAPSVVVASKPSPLSDKQEHYVYIEADGKKYHNDPKCSGMKKPQYIPISKAKRMGKEPCKKCASYRVKI